MAAAATPRPAVSAAVLYLLNLLLLPGLAFLLLARLWWTRRNAATAVERSHLDAAFYGSLLAGSTLAGAAGLILAIGGVQRPGAWVALILCLVTGHAAFVLAGVLMLVRALVDQPVRLFYRGGSGHE